MRRYVTKARAPGRWSGGRRRSNREGGSAQVEHWLAQSEEEVVALSRNEKKRKAEDRAEAKALAKRKAVTLPRLKFLE